MTKTRPQFSLILCSRQPLLPTKRPKAHKSLCPELGTIPASLNQPQSAQNHRNSRERRKSSSPAKRPTTSKTVQSFTQALPTGNRFCPRSLNLKTAFALQKPISASPLHGARFALVQPSPASFVNVLRRVQTSKPTSPENAHKTALLRLHSLSPLAPKPASIPFCAPSFRRTSPLPNDCVSGTACLSRTFVGDAALP